MGKRFIFRLMHVYNLETYFQDGFVNAKNKLPIQQCYQTSYADIVHRRGSDFRTPCDCAVNDFVPFYFSPSTAMAYAIHVGKVELIAPDGSVNCKASMNDIAYIVADPLKVAESGHEHYFTNIACNSGIQPKYENDIKCLEEHINWSLFDAKPNMAKIPEIGYEGVCKYCSDSELQPAWLNRKKQRMAEFLIKSQFPMYLAECIIIKHDRMKNTVEDWIKSAGLDIPVIVNSSCYF